MRTGRLCVAPPCRLSSRLWHWSVADRLGRPGGLLAVSVCRTGPRQRPYPPQSGACALQPGTAAMKRLMADERGAISVLAAGVMILMVGMAALTVAAGLWYLEHRRLRTAAAAAAVAAAGSPSPATHAKVADEGRRE